MGAENNPNNREVRAAEGQPSKSSDKSDVKSEMAALAIGMYQAGGGK